MTPADMSVYREYAHRIDEAFEAGAVNQGREILERALEASTGDPSYHEFFRGAAARYLAGDREEQIRRLRAAVALSPGDGFLARSLAISLSLDRQDDEAIDWFDEALALDPGDYLSMRKKGVSLSRLGRMDEALMWFDNALEANPGDAASMRNLGVTLSRTGRHDDALEWFDKALAINPQDRSAMRQKGVSLAMLGRHDEALAWYDKALELNPADASALVNKARTLLEQGRYQDASEVYEHLIALDPKNPYYHLEKAIALARQGERVLAAETVEQAFAIANPSVPVKRGKSYWLNRLGLDRALVSETLAKPRDAGGEYGDIARVMEKTWEIFREDVTSFRRNIQEAKNSLSVFLNSSSMFGRDRIFLLGARKWNSFTPSLPLEEEETTSVGGGYFLSANGVGTVIDPGFNFLENFNAMGGRLADIHNIVITHAHNDHTADLESLLTLFYQRSKSGGDTTSGRLRSRQPVNLFMNMGAFQKFSPMINLRRTDQLGEVRIIAPNEEYQLGGSGITMRILPANHDEIFSTTFAVGLLFTLPTRPAKKILFTGDTGLFPLNADITSANVGDLEIGKQYGVEPGEIDFFIPHLGSIGDNELKMPDRQDHLGESFYPNHLGVQGLIRLITQLQPKYVFVSEFGEELKGFIALLMELIIRCVREVNEGNGLPPEKMPVILPMDLYFFCDLAAEQIYSVTTESFEPLAGVVYKHLDKNNMSQFFYEPADLDLPVSDEYFAMKKLEYACKTNSGPFSDRANRTHRFILGDRR